MSDGLDASQADTFTVGRFEVLFNGGRCASTTTQLRATATRCGSSSRTCSGPTNAFLSTSAGGTLTDEYARMNPARTTPVLETDDGRFLPDANAILVYLADGTEYLPKDPFQHAEVVRWLVYEQTDVIPTVGGLRFRLLVGRLRPDDPDAIRRKESGEEVLRLLDDHLAER